MNKKNVLILGAAGRDFHNFNVYYKNNPSYNVVAFTATQIPDIDGRKYPSELSGERYPDGIPIYNEEDLPGIIRKFKIDEVVFSYSDISHESVMHKASIASVNGANFVLLGNDKTMIKSTKPVVSVCAIRTGCGKSQTTRRVAQILREANKKVVVIRHPMPYGNLVAQKVQRFGSLEDLSKYNCTIEEMEEYEPHINLGFVVYAGVDYEAILREAEKEADIILWDGGNNDTPFYRPNLHITVVDPHRLGHETRYYPGEANLRMANVAVINKIDTANPSNVNRLRENIRSVNPDAMIIEAASPVSVEDPSVIYGKRVLVVEDGPTLTHGEMTYGAGIVAARKFGALKIVDPREYTAGTIAETFEKYPAIGALLPAMGYSKRQISDLEETINNVPCDSVIIATPVDLRRVIKINKPSVRVQYTLQEIGYPDLEVALEKFL
jgi:predicted GTPase